MRSVEALFLLARVMGLDRNAQDRSAYSGVGARTGTPCFQLSPTTGTILVLGLAEVIQLTEDYYAPGSLG